MTKEEFQTNLDNLTQAIIELDEQLYQRIKSLANKQPTWIGNLIDKAVGQYLKKRKWKTEL